MQIEETEDVKRREADRQARLVQQAEEKSHGRNLWMKALDEVRAFWGPNREASPFEEKNA